MNHFYRLVLSVGLFVLSSTLPAQEMRDSKGKDFWTAFPENYDNSATLSLLISSDTATSGTVSVPGLGYSSNFTTTPGAITTVTFASSYELRFPDSIENKGIHISALKEVTVYGISRKSATTDAFLCLPTDVLGDSYIIPSYQGINDPSQLVVVGTQNATTVTITPTVTAQSRTANVPFTITLNQGQAYQLQATAAGDLTGSVIISSAPVAVLGSVQCANVSTSCTACDFIAEEIPPVSTWGKSFISAPLAGRTGDIYRFLASEDNTTVSVNGSAVATLNKGKFFEGLYSTGLNVTSDKAILVVQYSRGQSCAGAPGDPFMMLIPPYEQFLGNYTISTSDVGYTSNFINLVVPTKAIGDVRVDGTVVPTSSFTAIGTTGFHYAAISISIGTHTIKSNYPVGVHVYGFGSYDSYGYPGGQSFSQIAYVDSIMLAPPTSTAQTGTSSCVQATVLDNNLNKATDVRVDFYVNGSNISSGFAFTDSNGIAVYCYTGLTAGTDSIHAVTGSLTSNTVYKTWTSNATKPVANAGPDQTISTGASGCVALATLDGTGSSDPRGETITYRWTGPFSGFLMGSSPSVNLPLGTNQIILTVTNASSLTDVDTVIITVRDSISPVPNITTLPDITAQCSITLTPPTATDNCGGVINGTTPIMTFNTQDTFNVEWTYRDPSGNISQQFQTVIINDNTPPVPQQSPLPVVTGNCSAEITAPTALDSCTGIVITGTTTDPRSFNEPGNYTITWRYTDANSNTSTQTQNVIINDITPPVPTVTNLPELSATCSLTVTTIPTAFDSCTRKTITGSTTNPLTYNNPGIYTITWTYTDSSGNSDSQLQRVSIIDVTAPVPDRSVLDTIRAECNATVTDTPTATDNCCGTIRGVTSDSLTYSTQGTHTITWRYTDRTGNISTQNQLVVIDDTTRPVPLVLSLPDVQGECSATISSPPKASDNCGPEITATTSDPLTYTTQGPHTITWLYDDLRGNKITQTQSVIIKDTTPPVPELSTLPTITSACNVELTPPFANDNCAGKIAATTPSLSITNQGTHIVTWTYNDGNGNTATQNQTVIIKDSIPPVLGALSNKDLATKSTIFGVNVPVDSVSATDNCTRVTIKGVRDDGLRLDTLYFEGITRITWTACDTNKNCSTALQTITVIRNRAPALQIPADTSLSEGEILSFSISASDSNGTTPSIFIDSLSFPFVFKDSANGRAALSLRPGCTDHGNYTIKVHATDGIDTTTKTFVVNIKDVNYPPVFDTASYFIAHEMVEFKTTIKVYDCDNPNPKIRIVNPPTGAQFTDNNNGTGTFIWTPGGSDNGFYMIIFEAQDDMTTVRDTIIIEITDVNAYPPELTVSFSDSTVPLNLPVVIYASARDRDGPSPVIRSSALPSGSQFDADNNGNAIVRWTPKDTGTFRFDFIAIDAADTTVKVVKQVKLTVSNINVTGPKFSPVQNFVIDQNKQFSTTIEAHDPDGTIPTIHLKRGQQTDLTFKDNGNGTATISWIPPCNVTGTFYLTATASDQSITDSVTFTITVRDVNCPPVIFRTSDINAKTGEMVRIYVRAYDPDGDTVIPTLSAGCALPGYSFTNSGNGTGVFRWQASYESGSYPVTFYASDGFETDSFTMHININMTGYVKIICTTPGSSIYATPCGSFTGEFLGVDSARLGVSPGIYNFEINKAGYCSERFSMKVFSDSSVVKICTLKPSIPLMTSVVDTAFHSQTQSQYHSVSTFTDLNNDGYLDFTVLSSTGIKVFPGLDSSGLKYNSKSYDFPDSIPAASIFHYGFVDWNNDKFLDCIYSDLSGNIVIANFRNGTFESVVSVPEGKLYLSVLDVNNDHKKDLIINNEGYGLFVYLNQGTDNSPVFTSSYQLAITSGQPPATLHGPFTFIDIDGNGELELLIKNGTTPALFKIASNFTEMSYIEDLNCAGKRISSDTLMICQIGSPSAMPHIILRTAAQSILFNTRLLGDVNNDNKVDIRDISKISRLWEITDTDPSWDPQCNLRLSTSGQEKIDIRDISQAGKCWELQQ
jgi:hypothetical protein